MSDYFKYSQLDSSTRKQILMDYTVKNYQPAKQDNNSTVFNKKHGHYYKDVSKLKSIDVYRVIELFNVTDPCLQHAIKKLLVSGGRDGNKTKEQDIQDVIASCNRWLEMQTENI